MRKKLFFPLVVFVLSIGSVQAQNSSLFIPIEFQKAVEEGTRSLTGNPGANYFQNSANYEIHAEFNPETAYLKGFEKISYFNNSPDSVRNLVIRLYQDILKADAERQDEIDNSDIIEGVTINFIKLNGQEISMKKTGKSGTNLIVPVSGKLAPKSKLMVEISWEVQLPNKTLIRMGRYDSTTYFVAYWYPQIAVYDDIKGWNIDNYTGLQEFYNDYGDFDVTVRLPKNYIMWATGELHNAHSIFTKTILDRFALAGKADTVVAIINAYDLSKNLVLKSDKSNEWNFKANHVSDFAFGVSTKYVWDGTSVEVDSTTHRRVMANAVYSFDSEAGKGVAAIARNTILHMSTDILGVSYPYPHNTVWEGHFGMEFPMLCNDGPAENLFEKVFVTSHEVSHSYFPFMVGTNETYYGWIDEGLITLLPKEIEIKYGNTNAHYYINSYARYAMGKSIDLPLSVPTTEMSKRTYMMQNYGRAAVGFYFLRDMLGKEEFGAFLKEFIHRWEGKHPTPTDMVLTLNDVTGKDWSWYWNTWFYNYGYADLQLSNVNIDKSKLLFDVNKIGLFPVPINIIITYTDDSQEVKYMSAEVWKNKTSLSFDFAISKKIKSVKLGDKNIPDAFLSDNFYENRGI